MGLDELWIQQEQEIITPASYFQFLLRLGLEFYLQLPLEHLAHGTQWKLV